MGCFPCGTFVITGSCVRHVSVALRACVCVCWRVLSVRVPWCSLGTQRDMRTNPPPGMDMDIQAQINPRSTAGAHLQQRTTIGGVHPREIHNFTLPFGHPSPLLPRQPLDRRTCLLMFRCWTLTVGCCLPQCPPQCRRQCRYMGVRQCLRLPRGRWGHDGVGNEGHALALGRHGGAGTGTETGTGEEAETRAGTRTHGNACFLTARTAAEAGLAALTNTTQTTFHGKRHSLRSRRRNVDKQGKSHTKMFRDVAAN